MSDVRSPVDDVQVMAYERAYQVISAMSGDAPITMEDMHRVFDLCDQMQYDVVSKLQGES
jgi:hypothetical protein